MGAIRGTGRGQGKGGRGDWLSCCIEGRPGIGRGMGVGRVHAKRSSAMHGRAEHRGTGGVRARESSRMDDGSFRRAEPGRHGHDGVRARPRPEWVWIWWWVTCGVLPGEAFGEPAQVRLHCRGNAPPRDNTAPRLHEQVVGADHGPPLRRADYGADA